MSRPTDLPEFADPPLTEVAISVQFDHLTKFSILHTGPLWFRFKDKFPKVEYHPPLPPIFETFGLNQQQPQMQQIELRVENVPGLPRLWFLDEKGSELVQFQPDRFVHNWRKAGEDREYPRYEAIRERFVRELEMLQAFAGEHEIGEILPNQCEVTYVNVITMSAADEDRLRPAAVLRLLNSIEDNNVGPLEDTFVRTRYHLRGDGGSPIGRIVVTAAPNFDPSGNKVLHLNITGRGPPAAQTIPAALEFIDKAREAIVRTFAAVTTETMHNVWKRGR